MSWDDLNMREKAAMMRVAVRNKIFDIGLIKELYNKFSEGGYIYSTPEEKALLKANNLVEPASNYSEATDMSISSLREWITDIVLRTIPECPTGLSNCTLTASLFYGKPIGRAATIVSNPEANNFYLVSEDYAVPGTMVIASSPEGTPNPVYHTMILSGYADKDYPFEYNGIHYDIKKGDPLVHYSKGKNSADNYKKNIPLKVYTDLSHGKTLNRYYRPFDENNLPNVLLPELVVLPTNNLALLNNVNMYEDGGHKYVSYYDLANDPQYGYHLIEDGKDGQPTYYNANTGQWFLASKALDEGRLSEIKSGDTFTPIIANPVPELPAVSNYISSLISNMLRPLTEELAWDKLLEKAKETFSYFPGIGEAIDVYDAGTELLKGNYGVAAAGLGLMLLPEWAEKGVRKGGKWFKNYIKNKDKYNFDVNTPDEVWDNAYFEAIKNNDNEAVLLLRDLHFKTKAPNTKTQKKYYHGVNDSYNPTFTVFNPNRIHKSIYAADDKDVALSYFKAEGDDRVKELYVNLESPVEINNNGNPWSNINISHLPSDVYNNLKYDTRVGGLLNPHFTTFSIEDASRNNYDGVIIDNITDYGGGAFSKEIDITKPHQDVIVHDNRKLKLADPITYDNNGNIIPLSKRDNFNNPDIRYNWVTPLLIGGSTGALIYGNEKDEYRHGGKINKL